ncbi:MAG: hypothetical protein ACM3SM_09725 [Bacteroidota bacterium]
MKSLQLVPVCAFLLFSFSGCSNPNESIPPDNTPPGSRDYVWTVDTLKTDESFYVTAMWGSSSEDVWAVGSSSRSATTIWHYNGKQWSYDDIYRQIDPTGIWGFSNNEVWLVNSNGRIWKYDGFSWKQFGFYTLPNYERLVFQDVYGTSPDNVYAFGHAEIFKGDNSKYEAILMHYDGSKWSLVDIPKVKLTLTQMRVDQETNTLIFKAFTVTDDHRIIDKVLTWNGTEFNELVSGKMCGIVGIKGKVYVTIENKMYRYNKGNLEYWIERPGIMYFGMIWGARNMKDFFHSIFGGIDHYNGSDFKVLYKTDLDVYYGFVLEKDVYFTYQNKNTRKNIVIHGKLKETIKE